MAKKKWIPEDMKEGALTKQAKSAGMGVQEFADAVLSGKVKASSTTKKRASLAKTFKKMSKSKAKKKKS
jgi:hypothetical protein